MTPTLAEYELLLRLLTENMVKSAAVVAELIDRRMQLVTEEVWNSLTDAERDQLTETNNKVGEVVKLVKLIAGKPPTQVM